MSRKCFLLVLLVLASVNVAQAYDYTPPRINEFSNLNGPFNFTFNNLPTPTGDGILTLRVCGDFDTEFENYDVYLNNAWYGTVLNNNTSDDQVRNSNDVGSHYSQNTAWIDLTQSSLANYVTSGLTVRIAPSANVNDDGDGEYLEVNLNYAAAPEPASLGLLALGGILLRRKVSPCK